MKEDTLNLAAIAIELGTPVLLFIGCWLFPKSRTVCVTTLIALLPALLLYLIIAINHLTTTEPWDFAFEAMWLMTFLPYMVLLTLGLVIGIARHEKASSSPAA